MRLFSKCRPDFVETISDDHLRITPELKSLYGPNMVIQSVLPIDVVRNDISKFNEIIQTQKLHYVEKLKELDLQHRKAREFQEAYFYGLLQTSYDQLQIEQGKVTSLDESFGVYRHQTNETMEDLRDSIVSLRSTTSRTITDLESRLVKEKQLHQDHLELMEKNVAESKHRGEIDVNDKLQVSSTLLFMLSIVEERHSHTAAQENAQFHQQQITSLKNQFQIEMASINAKHSSDVLMLGRLHEDSVRNIKNLFGEYNAKLKINSIIEEKISKQDDRIKSITEVLKLNQVKFYKNVPVTNDARPSQLDVSSRVDPVTNDARPSQPDVSSRVDPVTNDARPSQPDVSSRIEPVTNDARDSAAQTDTVYFQNEEQVTPLAKSLESKYIQTDKEVSFVVESDPVASSKHTEDVSKLAAELERSASIVEVLLQREADLIHDINQMQEEKNRLLADLSLFISYYKEPPSVAQPTDEFVSTCKQVQSKISQDVKQGSSLWKLMKRDECYDLYIATCQDCCKLIGQMVHESSLSEKQVQIFREIETSGKEAVRTSMRQSQANGKAKSAVNLRKWIDSCLQQVTTTLESSLVAEIPSLGACGQCTDFVSKIQKLLGETPLVVPLPIFKSEPKPTIVHQASKSMDDTNDEAETSDNVKLSDDEDEAPQAKSEEKGGKALPMKDNSKQNIANARQLKEKDNKIRKMEDQIKKLNDQLAAAASTTADSSGANTAALQRQIQRLESTSKKQSEDSEKKASRDKARFEADVTQLTTRALASEEEASKLNSQVEILKSQTSAMSNMQTQVNELQLKANEAEKLGTDLSTAQSRIVVVEDMYKQEMILRKKYWNMLEDMKGKIRVYMRCRPMAGYEIERGCQQCIQFLDATSVDIIGAAARGGNKQFSFDSSFAADSTQDAVFEDCRNLVQSCIDGFNVCIFAYGQTGSGKTFTMTGSDDLPGLTPRAVREIFSIAGSMTSSNKAEINIETYFVELYNDGLVDLYYKLDNAGDRQALADPPRIEIKVDPATKMVVLKNTVLKPVSSDAELMNLFRRANDLRHTGATKMNAASSRSHSVFAIQVTVRDKTTNKVSVGKLSLVDLAGSERADKTGATGDRLKEAQNINLSLSALGDVINALSTSEKFIPYRNNKLTQLMQDSLGGNAKTLMFVNVSPADYNMDETVSSLNYASRVKLITNQANKNQDSSEVARLKDIIKRLKSGQSIDDDDNDNNEEKPSV